MIVRARMELNGTRERERERDTPCACKRNGNKKGESSSIALEALEKVPSKHARRGWDLNLRTLPWIEARTLL